MPSAQPDMELSQQPKQQGRQPRVISIVGPTASGKPVWVSRSHAVSPNAVKRRIS
ncbi:hypothetical protein GSD1FS_0170 [Bifidobacterium sp. GSD1FS]|uniref:Uncharacterized protein n=1 Tax=Bifidobacterium canis TaxID=2610880 RepID=A0A7K1J2L3_9BIFI|nr:hypothetical protein [Bifidobacterium canis]